MKIIHTSDWHLGHSLYGYDRAEEQAAMLLQMVDIVRTEQPDALLVCGDIYHTAQPSTQVQTMFTGAIVALHEACPRMTIVITAGNHDSSTRHEIFKMPWQALNVHAIGVFDKEQPEQHIIRIPGKGIVVAIPYANERRSAHKGRLPEQEHSQGFYQDILDRVSDTNEQQLPVVMMAHTTVRGCDVTGHEHATAETVGGIDCYDLNEMGTGYDYLALGHIHHAQFLHGSRHKARYAGTPLPVSFDECYSHSVSIVEISGHGAEPDVRTIEINNLHPLVTLPSQGTASWEEAKQLLASFPDDNAAYIRLNVETRDFLPVEANAEASALTQGKQCRFCYINVTRKSSHDRRSAGMTVEEFRQEDPLDLARRYAEDSGIGFDEDMESLFSEAMNHLEDEQA